MTSLATLRTRLSEDYTRDPNYRIRNQSAVERAINKWYTRVQKDLWWTEWSNENNATTSTVAGSELYDLPSDFIRMKLIRYNGDDLVETTRKAIKRADETSQSWTPHRYYLYNNKLGLYPVPSAVGTLDLEYYQSETTLSSAQDTQLPSIVDDAILLFAAYKLFLWVRDTGSAQSFYQDYQDEVNTLRMTLLFDDENVEFSYQRYGYSSREDVLDFNPL